MIPNSTGLALDHNCIFQNLPVGRPRSFFFLPLRSECADHGKLCGPLKEVFWHLSTHIKNIRSIWRITDVLFHDFFAVTSSSITVPYIPPFSYIKRTTWSAIKPRIAPHRTAQPYQELAFSAVHNAREKKGCPSSSITHLEGRGIFVHGHKVKDLCT